MNELFEIADEFTVFRDGGGVSITLAPGTPAPIGTALQKAQAVVAPLRLGVNIERGEPVFDGWVNDAFLAKIKEQGLTHIRLFPNSGGSYSLYSQNDMTHWYNIVANATENYGILVHLDFLDIMDENQIRTADVENYIRACADSVAARNFNPNLAIFGVCNEYMAGTNVGFEEPRERLTNILHEKLPNHVIVTNSADWGNPWTLVNGTMKVYPSKPRIHQWHWYPDPESQAVAEDVNFYLKKWCRDESAVTINGEYNVNNYPTEYHRWPGVIRNAFKGMPEQRTTMWSIIGKSVSYFRLNEWDSAMLTSDVAAAYVEGDAYIRGLQWYKDGLSGGTTPPPDTATPTITIEPADPGTLTETVSGQGAARTASSSAVPPLP